MVYPILVIVLTAYLLGNLNGAVCISVLMADDDVRKHGSGNAGLTNFARNFGGWATLLVLLVDAGKTVMACLMGGMILEPYGYGAEGAMLGAVVVSLGHDFPALLGFRGGKGIVCGFASAMVIDWRAGLLILAVFALVYFTTHYVSLASLCGAVVFCVSITLLHLGEPLIICGGLFLGILAIVMHRANIRRLIQKTEKQTHLFRKEKNQ